MNGTLVFYECRLSGRGTQRCILVRSVCPYSVHREDMHGCLWGGMCGCLGGCMVALGGMRGCSWGACVVALDHTQTLSVVIKFI